MKVRLHSELSADERERAAEVDADVWPEYNRHGDVLGTKWARMLDELAEYQFVVEDDSAVWLEPGDRLTTHEDGTLEITW